MNGQPCDCQILGTCRLCAIWGRANGLPVAMPKSKQPTADEMKAFLDREGGGKKTRAKVKKDEGGLFTDLQE